MNRVRCKEVKAIILAGGYGSRMGEITQKRQKCVLSVDGIPIIVQIINELEKAFGNSSVELLVGVSYRSDDVREVMHKSGKLATFVYHKPGSESSAAYMTFLECVNSGEVVLGLPGDVIIPAEKYAELYELSLMFLKLYKQLLTVLALSPNMSIVDTHALIKANNTEPYLLREVVWPVSNGFNTEGYFRYTGVLSFTLAFLHHLRFIADNDLYGHPVLEFMLHLVEEEKVASYNIGERWFHLGYPDDLDKSW